RNGWERWQGGDCVERELCRVGFGGDVFGGHRGNSMVEPGGVSNKPGGIMYAVYVVYVNIECVVDICYANAQNVDMDESNSERVITPMSKALIVAIDDFR